MWHSFQIHKIKKRFFAIIENYLKFFNKQDLTKKTSVLLLINMIDHIHAEESSVPIIKYTFQ